MLQRSNTILAQSGTTTAPQWGASYRVLVTPMGARVNTAGSGVNLIGVDAPHSFRVGDKFLRNPGSSNELSQAITAVTANGITIAAATYNVAVGDVLVNLGPDTSSGSSPNYNASPVQIFADPDGGTPFASSIMVTSSVGGYGYYYRGDGSAWELILDAGSVPVAVVQGFGGGERVNVIDFGAVGDGTTDDGFAFAAAAMAVSASGGTIYVPAGTYLLGPTNTTTNGYAIQLADNVRLIGEGREVTILKGRAGVGATNYDIVQMLETDYNEIRDISFDGNGNEWKNAVRGWGVRYATYHHLFAKDFIQHAVSIRKGDNRGSTECLIDNVISDGCDETGIIVWARATAPDLKNTYIRISNCVSKNAATYYGFEIRYSDYCTIVNCQAFGNFRHGFTLEESANHNTLVNCIGSNNTGHGMYLEGNISAAQYNTITNCQFTGNTGQGVLVRSCDNNTFNGCVFKDNTLNGYSENADLPLPQWNSVVDCVIESNRKVGLRVFGSDFLLRGGRVTNNGTAGAEWVRGLWLQEEALRARIIGTYFEGNVETSGDQKSSDVFTGLGDPATADHIIDTPTPGFSYLAPLSSRFPGHHPAVSLPHQPQPDQATAIVTDTLSFNFDNKVLKADTQYQRVFDIPLDTLFDGANDDLGQTNVHIAARLRAITDNLSVRWSDGTDFSSSDDVLISASENWRWVVKNIALASLSAAYVQSMRMETNPATTGYILLDSVLITVS